MSLDIEPAEDNKQISISRLTYRGMQIIIAVGLSGVMALSSWTLITVYSISIRVTSIESKMETASALTTQATTATDNTVKTEMQQLQTNLNRLEDKLNMALGVKSRR